MDIFVMVRRKKLTMFLDAKETTSVWDLKRMISSIIKNPADDIVLHNAEGVALDEKKNMADNSYTHINCKAQLPALIKLALKQSDGTVEEMEITAYTTPPELPSVMKQGDLRDVEGTA